LLINFVSHALAAPRARSMAISGDGNSSLRPARRALRAGIFKPANAFEQQ